MNVLVFDPNTLHREILGFVFGREGHAVSQASQVAEARAIAQSERCDLVILCEESARDDESLRLCAQLHRIHPGAILVAIADGPDERRELQYFEAGADDVLTRPVSFDRLLARCRAHCRRVEAAASKRQVDGAIVCGELKLLPNGQAVYAGQPLHLTRHEFTLLRALASRQGRTASRDELLVECWGHQFDGASNQVDVYINKLRRKIEPDPAQPRLIRTVRGVGYALAG